MSHVGPVVFVDKVNFHFTPFTMTCVSVSKKQHKRLASMSISTTMGKDQGESVTIRALETGWDHTRVYLVKQHFCMILTIEPEN